MTDGKHYNILQTVASGGTAVLYRALQISLDRVVAVKRLHAHLTQDDNFTRRFVLEAKAAASLDHQNIVRVIDFGVEDGSYQMVMEFVEGESLKEILDRWRPLQSDAALAIVYQVCRGLEHAHSKGIVHRDIKPGNIMITKSGTAKITDFGLAKLTQSASVQTAADSILGTPLYMSPEQAFGESVDQRSDLFSLGTVLYELLTGRQPFASENYMGVIQNIIHKEIPAVRDLNPAVSVEAEAIVMRALAKNRDERFQSARAFREAIEAVLGLDGLNRSSALLPALLEHDAPTRILVKSTTTPAPSSPSSSSSSWRTISSTKKRQRSGPPMWAMVMIVTVVLGGAVGGWLVWPRIRDGAKQAVAVQQSSMGNGSGFDALNGASSDPAPVHSAATSESTATGAGMAGDARADSLTTPANHDTTTSATKGAAESGPPAMPWKTPDPAPQPAAPPAADVTTTTTPSNPPATAPAKKARTTDDAEKPFREGYLLLNVEPSGQVYVNGAYRGEASPTLRLTLPAGMQSIECRQAQHETYLENLRIVPGELSQRTITLKKLRGIISLATTEGADFFVDGQFIGVTPILRPIEVAAGTHTLTLKKERYFTWTSEVTIEADATMPLRITLSPRY